MNKNKISFIICTNNELYENECIYYIRRLHIPKQFEIDIITMKGAVSMTAGYNEAMKKSDAKYKIYLHQDVFIIYQHFLAELLAIFENKEIGMAGIVGSTNIKESAVMWYSDRVGKLYSNSVYTANGYLFGDISQKWQEVSAIDGMLMATQYDIPWREDLFKHWDYYDISQSMEFRKKGYKVVVPSTETPWCIHDDGILNLNRYYNERDVFLKEYMTGKQEQNGK